MKPGLCIPLTRGRAALVDAADYAWLSQWRWHYSNVGYARRTYVVAGRQVCIYMHRALLPCPDGLQVDHINGNKLDNRRANLRPATHSQQEQNKPAPRIAKTSRFKGVSWNKLLGRWSAVIGQNGRNARLGCFASEVDAARAYDAAARERFGEFAYVNFRQEGG